MAKLKSREAGGRSGLDAPSNLTMDNGLGFRTSGLLVAYWVCYEYDSVIWNILNGCSRMVINSHIVEDVEQTVEAKVIRHCRNPFDVDKLDTVNRLVSSRPQRRHPAKKPRKINRALRKRKNKVRTEAPLHLSSRLATIQKSWNRSIDLIDACMVLRFFVLVV